MRRLLALGATAASLVACAVLVLAPAAPAAQGGNSANAKRCQKGGYQDWVRADQTSFADEGECVSYAAQGGTLTEPAPPAGDRAYCAPAGVPAFGQCSIPAELDFDFDASSGPLGENPTGTFIWQRLPFDLVVQVTCLQVSGNRASVGGTITASATPELIGTGFAFTALDNTPVGPDLLSGGTQLAAGPAADAAACGDSNQSTFSVAGDIVVEDN